MSCWPSKWRGDAAFPYYREACPHVERLRPEHIGVTMDFANKHMDLEIRIPGTKTPMVEGEVGR